MTQRDGKKQGYQSWNTPPEVVAALHAFMPISLDPCSNPHSKVAADVELAAPACDGLAIPWHWYGHTFVNPPYDDQPLWMDKAGLERRFYDAAHITMLIPSSTETQGFQRHVFGTADAVCFWSRRLRFWRDGVCPPKGGNTLPSALPYWGCEPARFAEHFSAFGVVVTDWHGKATAHG